MAVIEGGTSAVVSEVGAVAAKGLHVILKPTDYGALGHYSVGLLTGILPAALGANSEIVQFRWADATRIALIHKITLSACVSTTFFAAGVPVQIELYKATAWTVAGTLGVAPTMAALGKRRTSMGSSLVAAGDIRVSANVALGAGTKTLEANTLACLAAPGPITASLNGQIIAPGTVFFDAATQTGGHPFALVQNEGLVIRVPAVPATGTWTAGVYIEWSEVTAF